MFCRYQTVVKHMRKPYMSKFQGLAAIGVLMAAILGCGKSAEEKRADAERSERLTKMAAARPDLAKKPGRSALVREPYIKGKVVVLEGTDGAEPNWAYFPPAEFASIRAETPEEVGTVVLKECRSTQKGVYRTTENPPREVPAIAIDCDVYLVDHPAGSIYYFKKFEGKLKDEARVSTVSNSVSSGPHEEINKFLGSLPRR